jgi:NitT/TauT family transport system substrate-binding protein
MRWIAVFVLAVLFASGCGSSDQPVARITEPDTLKVGVIPITDVAPLYLGMKKGFFEAEHLVIEPQLAEGGAAIIPAVLSGDYQLGFSNTTSLIIAASKQLPVQIVTSGVLGGSSRDDAWDAVVVPKGSAVRTAKDLEGKTVAVNTLKNIGPVTINHWMEKHGGDYTKLKYVQIPFPEMDAALEAKRVDAAFTVEPAYSGAIAAGGKPLFSAYVATAPNLTVATYFASKQYIAENRELVERFRRAMERSLDYASRNDPEVRAVVSEYTQIPAAVTDKMHLPTWRADLNESTIQTVTDLALKYNYIDRAPRLSDMILGD